MTDDLKTRVNDTAWVRELLVRQGAETRGDITEIRADMKTLLQDVAVVKSQNAFHNGRLGRLETEVFHRKWTVGKLAAAVAAIVAGMAIGIYKASEMLGG